LILIVVSTGCLAWQDQAVLHSLERSAAASMASDVPDGGPKLSKDEIEQLLRRGAYDVFKEDEEGKSEAESNKFTEMTIDQILNEKSKVRRAHEFESWVVIADMSPLSYGRRSSTNAPRW
jgi:hypothetical protein